MSESITGGPSGREVFRLMYRSRIRIPRQVRKGQLGDVFSVARSNNKKQDISGALLVTDDWFVQILEGDEAPVRELFAHIERDVRHDSVVVLESGQVDERVFSRWAMAKVAKDGEPDIPLLARTDGIAPAAGHRSTPEQEQVLDVMRAATRVDANAV
jgi:Sensors of blue-light using FAD